MPTDQSSLSKSTVFFRAFTDHPASVDETYMQHALFAGRFSMMLFGAGFAALIHAIIPPLFEATASRMIANLNKTMMERH